MQDFCLNAGNVKQWQTYMPPALITKSLEITAKVSHLRMTAL